MSRLPLTLIIDNVRSSYNIGAIFRVAEAVNIEKIILCGISPFPRLNNDHRLPYKIIKTHHAIAKTALGSEELIPFEYCKSINKVLNNLMLAKYNIYALEQDINADNIFQFNPIFPAALIIGHERRGISKSILSKVSNIIQIPMYGKNKSLNVAVATGIALYSLLRK